MSSIEIKVPVLPESVSDATIAAWHKKPGEFAKQDEKLVDIETDKVVLEVVAPEDGVLESVQHAVGDVVKAQEVIALFKPQKGEAAKSGEPSKRVEEKAAGKVEKKADEKVERKQEAPQSPSARRHAMKDTGASSDVSKGKITSEKPSAFAKATADKKAESIDFSEGTTLEEGRIEKRVPMTRLRARIAERLVQAQQTAAILTTFNEINMQPVMELRQKYKESFEKNYGVRLGFMSFFTLAVVEALKHFPVINASIDGQDIVYHGYYDIGIAVSSPRGLVVPVLRNVETLTMAEIEQQIAEFSNKAKTGQLGIEEITGGTFTLSNGGVFGSLMSTPILNPPQSGILGMHKIQERVVVENGAMVIRPMMYVALSYDHRIIDGAESVRFLVTVKELLEDPARLVLGI